jgi:hypothetical protein
MAGEQLGTAAGTVYVDKLTAASVRSMLAAGVLRIIVLEELDGRQRKHLAALNRKGVEVEEAVFFAGHLKNPDGESVFLASRRLVSEVALAASYAILETQPLLKRLNIKYQRDTLRLSLAKNLVSSIEAFILRVQVAQALCYPAQANVWLAEPAYFSGELLAKYLPDVQLHFYPVIRPRIFLLFKKIAWDYARHIKRLWGCGVPIPRPLNSAPSVLMVQEDDIRLDRSLRGQPHWLDSSDSMPVFSTYIANLLSILLVAEDTDKFSKSALALVHAPSVRAAWKRRNKSSSLQRLAQDSREILRAALSQCNFAETAALLHTLQLFMEAQRMGALATYLNVRVFLTCQLSADPIQLVADDLNIKTIAFQYSNLGIRSPLMMTTSDYYVIFSEMYKSLFQSEGIGPKEWELGGYIYDGVADVVRSRAQAHRNALRDKGAEFIVCYFDESVQHNQWGLVNKDDHLAELHALAKAALEDTSFGVVIKSQFMKNTPSQLYPNDDLIQSAKATGRYLELMEGKHRNDIYPVEAALVADMCISHKFGATAALESAVAGVRTVLLDSYGSKTCWDALYAQVDIEYETIGPLMEAITRYRSGSDADQSLGDWSPILHHFDPYLDGQATNRLREVVRRCAVEAKNIH